jgi:branched-chain amino acid transport system permease protein
MTFWLIQSLNSLALGGLLFLLAAGFSIVFGLMRIANLAHGALFMLGGYVGLQATFWGYGMVTGMIAAALVVGLFGFLLERFVLRRLGGQPLQQVLVTLGVAFVIADGCLWIWGGDPFPFPLPPSLSGSTRVAGFIFPFYRLVLVALAAAVAAGLWFALEKTRLGASIRAAVDDMAMARAVGIRASFLFSTVFVAGAALAGAGGVLAGPILSVYPGLDQDMLPLALVVVILGGVGSLIGAFAGSMLVGFIYNFGTALVPDLAYVILFLPMVAMLALRPQGLFGRGAP